MKFKHLISIAATGIILAACSSSPKNVQTVIDGFAQGGTYHIVLLADKDLSDLKPHIDSMFTFVDNSMSLFNDSSLLCRINRGETDSLDTFIKECLREALSMSKESDGLYDVTVKPITSAYGFADGKPTKNPNIDSLLQYVGYEKISMDGDRLVRENPNIQIDLSSIAQGATSDYFGEYFDSLGIENYLVEVGGEIYSKGLNSKGHPWVVGIDKPVEGNFLPGAALQVRIGISGQGLATSGNYRKYYTDEQGRKIVHTINPKTGQPVISNLLSATVVAETSTLADAYGTLFMVMGLDRSVEFLKGRPDLQAYLVYSDDEGNYQTYMTPGMKSIVIE